jgi:D-glycero-D-manno-heptose 1,7-bisphosphate phosphatase
MISENKAIFFDRDGIINYRIVGGYVESKHQFKFIPDFFDLFYLIKKIGYLAIIISNQQGVGKGILSLQDLEQIHSYMQKRLINLFGFGFDDIFYCTDLTGSGSFRRKPNHGMLLEAIEKWNIDPKSSYMIGDSLTDVIAGKKAGTKTILINHYLTEKPEEADYLFKNLYQVADFFI